MGADGTATDVGAPTDGQSAASTWPAGAMLWNGATFDRMPGTTEVTALASAARTATTATATQTNRGARGIWVGIIVTAAGTGTLTLEMGNAQFGSAHQIWAAPAVSSATTRWSLMYPGANETNMGTFGGRIVSQALPRSFIITVTKSDASSWTFQVSYCLIP